MDITKTPTRVAIKRIFTSSPSPPSLCVVRCRINALAKQKNCIKTTPTQRRNAPACGHAVGSVPSSLRPCLDFRGGVSRVRSAPDKHVQQRLCYIFVYGLRFKPRRKRNEQRTTCAALGAVPFVVVAVVAVVLSSLSCRPPFLVVGVVIYTTGWRVRLLAGFMRESGTVGHGKHTR